MLRKPQCMDHPTWHETWRRRLKNAPDHSCLQSIARRIQQLCVDSGVQIYGVISGPTKEGILAPCILVESADAMESMHAELAKHALPETVNPFGATT